MGKHHKNLRNDLEARRKLAGLTQQELSVLADVSRKSINAIENGIYVPSTVLALKIASTLDCRVEDLFQLPPLGSSLSRRPFPSTLCLATDRIDPFYKGSPPNTAGVSQYVLRM